MKKAALAELNTALANTRTSIMTFNVLERIYSRIQATQSTTIAPIKPSTDYQQKVHRMRLSLLATEKFEVQELIDQHEASVLEWQKSFPSVGTSQATLEPPPEALELDDADSEHPLYVEYIPISQSSAVTGLSTPQTTPTKSFSHCELPSPLKCYPRTPS